jgi:hydroxyacylglutathione hydrolase
MNLIAVPAFTDNYVWMLHDGAHAIVVDPGEAAPVRRALEAHSLALAGIVVTHHHADHTGGVDALRARLPGGSSAVWGPAGETIPEPCIKLREGDTVELLGTRFEVIDVPGHTAGHIAYFGTPPGEAPLLFCGDTLFSAGCGRLFEGTAAQMHASLTRLAALPGSTRVCCGHEYTLANLEFARAVEPGNAHVLQYEAQCAQLRERGLATLPSTVAREREVNPFLRAGVAAVRESALEHGAAGGDALSVFAALRQWKNNYR